MSLRQTVKMVSWSLFGIRSSTGSDADTKAFRPAMVLVVAIAMLAFLLAVLLTIVHAVIPAQVVPAAEHAGASARTVAPAPDRTAK